MIARYELLLALAVALFTMGLAGVVIRRNLLVVVMSLELMLNAVVLSFVAAAAHTQTLHGAAMKGFTPFVKFLVENGADLYATDANGATALDLAEGNYNEPFLRQAAEPHPETAALLKELMAANPPPAEVSTAAASR